MKWGVRKWTRRGWRVVSQSGNFNLWNPFGRDTVTVVFEKRQEESPNAVDSRASPS